LGLIVAKIRPYCQGRIFWAATRPPGALV